MPSTTSQNSKKVKRFSFPPKFRLRKSYEFKSVQVRGEKLYCKHFLILVAPPAYAYSRLGITVTTKIDKRAVIRNKIKRRIRETFRQHSHLLTENFDIIVIARKNAGVIEHEQLRREILSAFQHKGYLKFP